jgi:hypothetical protein
MPRKPKPVTPPADDIPDEVLVALGAFDLPVPPEPDDDSRRSLEEVSAALVPLAETLRATIADIALIPVASATKAQRSELIALRGKLDRARADLSTWVDAIDISFRRAALETGATEFVLDDGVVKIEQQRGEWVVNVPALHAELNELAAHGLLSQEELASIFTTVVIEKADNSRLNYFASKRGTELAEAIGRGRMWKAGDPTAARVRIQRGGTL